MRPIVRHSVLALLLAAAAMDAAAAADDLGTLFNTPEERARLDKLRRGEPTSAAAPAEGAASPRRRSVTGYVQRSDGRNTVWIDGRPVVIASPDGKSLLDPRIVEPQVPERVLREENGTR
jgi:hypothetical protein